MKYGHAGTNLRTVRRLHGKTIKDLSGKLGISSGYLSLIEGGTRPLTPELRAKAAKVFYLEEHVLTGPPFIVKPKRL